jgi:hypothetical protein
VKICITLLSLFLVFNNPIDTRQQLIDKIFGGSLPSRQPDLIETGINDPSWTGIINLGRIDRITVNLEYGLHSEIYHFIPIFGNGQLLIWHGGHGQDFDVARILVIEALRRGYSVATFAMPITARNGYPVLVDANGHNWTLFEHGQLQYFKPSSGNPMRYFLDPVIVALNYFETLGYHHISMTGISGGGWTTTLIAALDTRVQSSFPVAGSMPLWARNLTDWGDWEQNTSEVYSIADYDTLYVLATDNGRRQLQILNLHDTCCYAGLRWQVYYDEVRQRSGGNWDLWEDTNFVGHDISPDARIKIFGDLTTFGEISNVYMPLISK